MSGIPILGSVTLSGATSIIRKEKDYIYEHQVAGKDGGLVERVGSASTRFEIKGLLHEADADTNYQSLIALLGTTSNLSIPTFGSGYYLAASGTNVYVESFGGNWIPGYGYPRYDYNLKLVATNPTPASTTPIPSAFSQIVYASVVADNSETFSFGSNIVSGDTIIVVVATSRAGATPGAIISDSQSNSYSTLQIVNDANGGSRAAVYKTVATSGALTVTITSNDTNTDFAIGMVDYHGTPSINSNANTSATNNLVSGMGCPVNSTGKLVISCLAYSVGAAINLFFATIQSKTQNNPNAINAAVGNTGIWTDDLNNPAYSEADVGIT